MPLSSVMLSNVGCSACGACALAAHISAAGEMGSDGLVPSTRQFGTALADIVRCTRCGHMQLHPMPEELILSHAYAGAAGDEYVDEEAGQRQTARRALDRIELYAASRGALADLGCWVGFLLAEARDRGWRTVGVEPSRFASAYARDRLGLEVLTADLVSAPLPRASFDAITMGDVIEHLVTPGEGLAQIRELLAPGGVLWLALPDAGSRVARTLGRRWWSVIPTHVQYFTRRSIATLLARQGFEVLEVTTAPKAFTVGYYLERLGGYSPAAGRRLAGTGRALGVAERVWAPDFRDRMAIVARTAGAGD